MKIISIKKINNKYKIILEDKNIITTYDEVIINNNILYKKELDEKLILKIEEENNYYETYNKILKYINTKLRSEYEIIIYMNKMSLDEESKNKIITKLKQNKLIDDNMYTKAYIHDHLFLTNDGPNKIKKDLINLKIDENVIENEINNIDKKQVLEKLEKMLIKKINTNTKYSDNMLKQKLLNNFINLGYEKEDIINIIENNKVNNNVINKEYEKIYNKYKNKYDEYELKRIIKQKLYQKGFNYEDINNIVK